MLSRRGLRAVCRHGVRPVRAGQPRMAYYTMPFIPSREDKDGPASSNRSTAQPQAMAEWRGGKA